MHFLCFMLYGLTLLFGIGSCKTDDSPGFFLKVTKNVPRLGKKSDKDFESSFLKNYKVIPRMGRSMDTSSLENWLNDNYYLKKFNKRMLMHSARIPSTESELSVVQPVNSNTLLELLEKDAIPSDNVKFVHWKDFDLALQLDSDLYMKVISLGRRPDQRLKQDLNIGTYTPLFNRATSENNGNDFLLFNDNADIANSDLMRYNQI